MIISKEQYDKLPEKYKIYFKEFHNYHPTVKPIKLMEYLVKLVCPPNGTVLDTFMGSGTTGVACANLNRNFIGIEKEQGYYEIAKHRIKKACNNQPLL